MLCIIRPLTQSPGFYKGLTAMARPIKETPVLKGDDARRFEKAMQESGLRKVSRENYERAMSTFQSVKVVSKKTFGT